MASSVLSLSRLLRRRRPDLIVNWIAKAQLYCSPAAVLAGMSDRLVWWQHDIPSGYWLDRLATALPALAVGCSSRASALAQSARLPSRRTFVVAPGPGPGPRRASRSPSAAGRRPCRGARRAAAAMEGAGPAAAGARPAARARAAPAHADRRRRRARALIGVRGVAGAAGQQAGPAGGGHDDRRRARRRAVYRPHGHPGQRLGSRAVRDRAAGGDGAQRGRRRRQLGRPRRDRPGRPSPACSPAAASPRLWRTRCSRCWSQRRCATSSAAQATSATWASTPTSRCAAGSSRSWRRCGRGASRAGARRR